MIEPFDIHDKEDISQQEWVYRAELINRGFEGESLERHVLNRMYGWKRSKYRRSSEKFNQILNSLYI